MKFGLTSGFFLTLYRNSRYGANLTLIGKLKISHFFKLGTNTVHNKFCSQIIAGAGDLISWKSELELEWKQMFSAPQH